MKNNNNKWELVGDVKPFTYGGHLVQADVNEGCYRVLVLGDYGVESSHQYLVTLCYVDINDSWINKKEVASYCGCSENELSPVDLISYYGIYEFGGSYEEKFLTLTDARNELKKYGVSNVNQYK